MSEFEPGHLGQLEFYLEALDRDVRKPHERPSIGVLLCASRTAEVVEYASLSRATSRATSPALVAEYAAHLPSKALLEAKLAEVAALETPQSRSSLVSGSGRRYVDGNGFFRHVVLTCRRRNYKLPTCP